jgi:GST-like protein
MITFYRIKNNSPNVQKVCMMLAETGLAHEVKYVERTDSGELSREFQAINPNLTVPAIVDHNTGAILFESAAILFYLAEQSGKLLPDNPQLRGETVNWLLFEAANVGPVVGEMFYYLVHDKEQLSDTHMQRYRNRLIHYCQMLEQRLSGREYLCDSFSIADIALYPWINVMEDMAEISLTRFPFLSSWSLRISQRPSCGS